MPRGLYKAGSHDGRELPWLGPSRVIRGGAVAASGRWTDLPAYHPGSALLAADPAVGDVLSFGGYGAFSGPTRSGPYNLTWTFSGGMWHNMTGAIAPPSDLTDGALASDPADHGVLLVGSVTAASFQTGVFETWLYSGGNWTELHPPSTPPYRLWPSLAWDPALNSDVLFGGSGSTGYLNDTWEFANGTWTNLSAGAAPPGRFQAQLSFDATDGYLLLFHGQTSVCSGGGCTNEYLNDTWAFRGGRWTEVFAGPGPAPTAVESMASNPSHGPVILYSAYLQAPYVREETWSYAAGAWQLLRNDSSVPPQFVGLVWDPEIRAVVESMGDPYVYQWNGTAWEYAGGVLGYGAAATYDTKDGYLVAYANVNASSLLDTYRFDGRNWWRIPLAAAPPHRLYPMFAYDPAVGGAILFGGTNATNSTLCYSDTWVYSGARWSSVVGSLTPPARCGGALTYDADVGGMILEGGYRSGLLALTDTWEFRDGSWTSVGPAHAPPPALPGGIGAFGPDPAHHWLVAFDSRGYGGMVESNQTWVYDGVDWTQLTPSAAPEPRFGEAAGFDPAAGYLLLVGGSCTSCNTPWFSDVANDTWGFVGGSWFPVPTSGGLPPVTDGSLVYDPGTGGMVLVGGSVYSDLGGTPEGGELADTWLLAPPRLTSSPEPILFRETGLPAGSVWGVTVGNATTWTNTTVVSFGIPNGSYTYTIPVAGDFVPTPLIGSAVLSGGVTTVGVAFHRDYTVPLLLAGGAAGLIAASVVAVWFGRKRRKDPSPVPSWKGGRYDVGTSFEPRAPFPRPPAGAPGPPRDYGPP